MSHEEQSPITKKKENKRQRKGSTSASIFAPRKTYLRKEVAEDIFDSLEKKNNFTSVSSINEEFTGRFVRRLHTAFLTQI